MSLSLKSSVLACAIAGVGFGVSGEAAACSCAGTSQANAVATSQLVATGSSMLAYAMTYGFESVGATVSASRGQSTKQIVDSLELLTKKLALEFRQLPARQAEMEANMEEFSPDRQATSPCSYAERTSDLVAAEELVAETQNRLNQASTRYSQMTANTAPGVNSAAQHVVRTAKLLQEKPEVMGAPMRFVDAPSSLGSMTAEDVQDAAIAINLTTNPNPPPKHANPASLAQVNQNAEADIFNLRMSFPTSVQNQILSYESPILHAGEDSWILDTLTNINPRIVQQLPENASISRSDLLSIMGTHRVKDPQWVAMLSSKGLSGSLKDLALAKADSMFLDYEIWKLERNTAMMLAQMLANQTRQERARNEN